MKTLSTLSLSLSLSCCAEFSHFLLLLIFTNILRMICLYYCHIFLVITCMNFFTLGACLLAFSLSLSLSLSCSPFPNKRKTNMSLMLSLPPFPSPFLPSSPPSFLLFHLLFPFFFPIHPPILSFFISLLLCLFIIIISFVLFSLSFSDIHILLLFYFLSLSSHYSSFFSLSLQ